MSLNQILNPNPWVQPFFQSQATRDSTYAYNFYVSGNTGPTGASTGFGSRISSGVVTGTTGPNGFQYGTTGDLFLNTGGGTSATLWVKESGVNTNTGWVAK